MRIIRTLAVYSTLAACSASNKLDAICYMHTLIVAGRAFRSAFLSTHDSLAPLRGASDLLVCAYARSIHSVITLRDLYLASNFPENSANCGERACEHVICLQFAFASNVVCGVVELLGFICCCLPLFVYCARRILPKQYIDRTEKREQVFDFGGITRMRQRTEHFSIGHCSSLSVGFDSRCQWPTISSIDPHFE